MLILNRLLVLLFVFTGSASATVEHGGRFPIRIEIADFGIYQKLDTAQRAFSAETTAGYASVISTSLVEQVDEIPLQKGLVFGFNFYITDHSTDQEWVPIKIKIKHPKTKNYMGKTAYGFTKPSAARLKADGSYHNGAFYVFSEPYEMVEGDWHITVIYRGEITVTKRFRVVEGES